MIGGDRIHIFQMFYLLLLHFIPIHSINNIPNINNLNNLLFTINIRIHPNNLIPHQVKYYTNDTPTTSATRFCQQVTQLPPTPHCLNVVTTAIKKRIAWSTSYQQVAHNISLLQSIDFNRPPPRFNVNNSTTLQQGVRYLEQHGYVVFSNVANSKQVQQSKALFWKFMQRFNAFKDQPLTWDNIPSNDYGIILQFGIGQSDFMWYVRTLPNVMKTFASVWDTKDLIVDFGGAVVLRPITNCTAKKWRTMESWYHVDQNAESKPGLQTIQGSLILSNQTKANGGLVVIPSSWKDHDGLSRRANRHWNVNDYNNHFLLVPQKDPIFDQEKPLFVAAEPGDLVLWDSRTVHCNTIGEKVRALKNLENVENVEIDIELDEASETCDVPDELQRLVALVSMAPRAFASDEVLKERRKGVYHDQTTTHWPHLFAADDPAVYRDRELSELQRRLIG